VRPVRHHDGEVSDELGTQAAAVWMRNRDGNGAGSGWVEHTHARPDMGSG
jgi:hypothetical protein